MGKLKVYLSIIVTAILGFFVWFFRRKYINLQQAIHAERLKVINKAIVKLDDKLTKQKATAKNKEKAYEDLKKDYAPLLKRMGIVLHSKF